MRALSPSKKPKKIIIMSIAVATLLTAGIYVYLVNRQQDIPTPPDTQTIKQEQVSADTQSQSGLPSKTGETTSGVPTETPSEQPEKPTIERASGSPTIKIVATLQKASKGYCELQLSQAGQQTLSYTAAIVVSASYYACNFTIARNAIPSGSWSVTVIHHIGEVSASSDAKELN